MRFHALPYRFLVAGSRWYFSYCWLASFWCCSQNRLSVRLGQPGWWHGCLAFLGILPTPPFVEFVFEDVPTLLQIRNLSISQNNHLLNNWHNKSPHSGVATMKASCVAALSFFFHDTIIAHIPLDIYRQTRTFSAHLYFYWIFWNRIMGQCLVMPSAYCTLIGI